MKTHQYTRTLGLLVFLAVSLAAPSTTRAQPGYGYTSYNYTSSYQNFYDDLAPYGQWIDYPAYGNVWVPDVAPDFQPYASNGHWVVTEYGNTWVSDYPWGWAAFHYGRWFYDDFYGWAWVPDNEWGPAWVDWRSGGGYYGWAPLGPGVNRNVVINIPTWQWVFVPQIYITSPRLYNYCVPRTQVVTIYRNCSPIRNYYRHNNHSYVYGPHRNDIERVTRSQVPVYRIDQMNRPGRSEVRDGSVRFYRPEVSGNRYGSSYPGRDGNGSQGNWQGNDNRRGRADNREGNANNGRQPANNWGNSSGNDHRENYQNQPGYNRGRSSQVENTPANRENEYRGNDSRGGWQQTGRRLDQPEPQQQSGRRFGQVEPQPNRRYEPVEVPQQSGRRIEPFNPQQPTASQPPQQSGTPVYGGSYQQPRQEQLPGQQPSQRQVSPPQESSRGGQGKPRGR